MDDGTILEYETDIQNQIQIYISEKRTLLLKNKSETSIASLDMAIKDLRRRLYQGRELAPNLILGDHPQYSLLDWIGVGGFSEVWSAINLENGDVVALKILRDKHRHDRTLRKRFEQGAAIMSHLSHPHIARIFGDVHQQHDRMFFAMEYLEGGTFDEAVREARLTLEKRLEIIIQIGQALQCAHDHGIIHRDVSPANIMLDDSLTPKIIDFDLAYFLDATIRSLSIAGGKIGFIAPEILHDGTNGTPRSDLYSLGMTTIFAIHEDRLTSDAHENVPAFIDELDLPKRLSEALRKATMWKPERRFGTINDYCLTLQDFRNSGSLVSHAGITDIEIVERPMREPPIGVDVGPKEYILASPVEGYRPTNTSDAADAAALPVPPSIDWFEEIHDALEAIPPEKRDVIRLSFLEGLNEAEVAERLKIPKGTVKSRKKYGLEEMLGVMMRRHLDSLPPNLAEIVRLRLIGMNETEIAGALGIDPDDVRFQLAHARALVARAAGLFWALPEHARSYVPTTTPPITESTPVGEVFVDQVRRLTDRQKDRRKSLPLLEALRSYAVGDLDEVTASPERSSKGPTLLEALRAELEAMSAEVPTFLTNELREDLDQLAERFMVRDSFLYVPDGDCLRDLGSKADNEQTCRTMYRNGPGIIPHTARTNVSYCSNDVDADPFYCPIVFPPTTRSEQAGAISWYSDGRLERLAVINQESQRPHHFSPATAQLLQESAQAQLTLSLLNLKAATERRPACSFPTLWSPRLHGWDLRDFLAKILKSTKGRLGPRGRGLQLVVWYVDHRDQVLFSLATTGFGSVFVSEKTLPIDQTLLTGKLAVAAPGQIVRWTEGEGGTARPKVDDAMGQGAFRAVKVMDDVVPGSLSPDDRRYGVMMSVYAFRDRGIDLLPDDDDLRAIARLIEEQVKGYAWLFVILAEAHANRAVYRSAGTEDQGAALAGAVREVFKADAVTLYARPRSTKQDLHILAATAPLSPGDDDLRAGAGGPAPVWANEGPLARSLVPSSVRVGDIDSYAGVLAARPDRSLRRNLFLDSRAWLDANGWPRWPSRMSREYLPRTIGADPKLLGCAMQAWRRPDNPAMAVGLVVRSSERPPYTAWDEQALEMMIRNWGHGVICTWRDWYAVMKPIGRKKSELPDEVARPLPRINAMSLKSVARELTATTHDLLTAGLHNVYQVWTLAERPGAPLMSVVPIGYFSEFHTGPPPPGHPFALNANPDLDWSEPFTQGGRWVFSGPPLPEAEVTGSHFRLGRRVCIPWKTWMGHHMCRGLLVVDMNDEVALQRRVLEMLSLLARKTAAAFSVAWTTLDHTPFNPWTSPAEFVKNLWARLRCQSVRLELMDGNDLETWKSPEAGDVTASIASEWRTPQVVIHELDGTQRMSTHRDAEQWGVREASNGDAYSLSVPLYFGMHHAGTIQAFWTHGPPTHIHGPEGVPAIGSRSWDVSLWVRDIVAAWSLWSWSWSESLDPGKGWITEELLGLDDFDGRFRWKLKLTNRHDRGGHATPRAEPSMVASGRSGA